VTTAAVIAFRKRRDGWAVAAMQIAFALWFAGWVGAALARDGRLPGWPALLTVLTLQAGLVIAPVGLIASGLMLALGYAHGQRALFVALLVGSLAMVATIAAVVGPAGALLGTLLD
jgi:hypothetical protein